jgi:hypothetical protein
MKKWFLCVGFINKISKTRKKERKEYKKTLKKERKGGNFYKK